MSAIIKKQSLEKILNKKKYFYISSKPVIARWSDNVRFILTTSSFNLIYSSSVLDALPSRAFTSVVRSSPFLPTSPRSPFSPLGPILPLFTGAEGSLGWERGDSCWLQTLQRWQTSPLTTSAAAVTNEQNKINFIFQCDDSVVRNVATKLVNL